MDYIIRKVVQGINDRVLYDLGIPMAIAGYVRRIERIQPLDVKIAMLEAIGLILDFRIKHKDRIFKVVNQETHLRNIERLENASQ
jgi:hypothetical protein